MPTSQTASLVSSLLEDRQDTRNDVGRLRPGWSIGGFSLVRESQEIEIVDEIGERKYIAGS